MAGNLSPIDTAKFVAAKRAVDFVEDKMRVGLGTGSTAAWMVRALGERVREEGLTIMGVPTSTRTAELAAARSASRWSASTRRAGSTSPSTAPTNSTPIST